MDSWRLLKYPYHHIIIKYLNDDQWGCVDYGLRMTVDENIVKNQHLVPTRRQRFINHIGFLALAANKKKTRAI